MAALPSCFDRGDGQGGRIGNAAPSGAVIVKSAEGADVIASEELPDSPVLEHAEQFTAMHRCRADYDTAVSWLLANPRGTFRTDSQGYITRVLSSTVRSEAGNAATFETVEEGINIGTPPDEFDLTPVELGVNIIKHPRYFSALNGSNGTERSQNMAVIRMLQDYMENPSFPYRNAIPKFIYDSLGNSAGDPTHVSGTDLAKRAALEIIQKFWRNEETPYVVGLQVIWSVYYWAAPQVNCGGYSEDPRDPTTPWQVPDYFWLDADGTDILSLNPTYNPQCYSSTGAAGGSLNMTWLRKADQLHYQRTWFKLDRIWIGSPVGFWDTELYSAAHRPSSPSDFTAINPAELPDYLSS